MQQFPGIDSIGLRNSEKGDSIMASFREVFLEGMKSEVNFEKQLSFRPIR